MARETEKVVFCTELALTAFCSKTKNASQSWPTVQLAVQFCNCLIFACTGLLMQHYLTVITIKNSLTQCTAGADQC